MGSEFLMGPEFTGTTYTRLNLITDDQQLVLLLDIRKVLNEDELALIKKHNKTSLN